MSNAIQLIVYPVKDLAAAKKFYGAFLGTEPYADSAYYVGYKAGDIEIGLDPNSTVGPIAYVDVDDVAATLASMAEAGGQVVKDASDVGGGLIIGQVQDANGNVVGFRQRA